MPVRIYYLKRLSNNAKQVTHKCTSKYIIAMFSVLYDLTEMKPSFLKVFEQTALPTKTNRHICNSVQLLLEIFISIEKAVRRRTFMTKIIFSQNCLIVFL